MNIFRAIYDLIILIVFILGIIKLINADYFLAFIWVILVPVLMLLPRNLYKINYIKKNYNYNLVNFYEILAFILLLTGISLPLGIKNINLDFDTFSHFLNLTLITIMFGVTYYIIFSYNYKQVNKTKVIIFALIFSLVFGVLLWEKFQYYGDKIFNTQMYYDLFQDIELDNFLDQLFGTIGVLTGVFILYNKLEDWIRKWKK